MGVALLMCSKCLGHTAVLNHWHQKAIFYSVDKMDVGETELAHSASRSQHNLLVLEHIWCVGVWIEHPATTPACDDEFGVLWVWFDASAQTRDDVIDAVGICL